jgi:hypothetical protein
VVLLELYPKKIPVTSKGDQNQHYPIYPLKKDLIILQAEVTEEFNEVEILINLISGLNERKWIQLFFGLYG